MTFKLDELGEAIASSLAATGVAVFASPPSTINPPALIVGFPDLVDFNTTSIALDTATVSVDALVGLSAPTSDLSNLIDAVRGAIRADPTLGGWAARANVTQLRQIRSLQVAGIDVLAAELVLSVDS